MDDKEWARFDLKREEVKKEPSQMPRLIFIALVALAAGYFVYLAYVKNTESEERGRQCQSTCTAQGYAGFAFSWSLLSGPQCNCEGQRTQVEGPPANEQ